MTDKRQQILEEVLQLKDKLDSLHKLSKEDNPYDYTLNSMFEWAVSCLNSMERHLSKIQPARRRAALDFDHDTD